MDNLIRETIEQIRSQHIVLEPRWKFLARKYGLWILFIAAILLGSSSLSFMHYLISGLDWDLYNFLRQNRLAYGLSIFPYIWAIMLGLFLFLAYFEIRRTEKGYRYSWPKIALLILGGIILAGIAMSLFDFGGKFHPLLEKNIPYYSRHMLVTKKSQWMQPEKGFLAGSVVASNSKNDLSFEDFDDKKWHIIIDENTLIKPSAGITSGETVKIIGTKQDENNFQAKEIRPWEGRGIMRGGGRNESGRGMMKGR